MGDQAALNEREKQAVRAVYEEIAEEYDQRLSVVTPCDARFTETEQEFVLERISGADRVLDIGCGTGRFTIPIAAKARRTVGLDFCRAMLDVARKTAARHQVRIDFHEGDMTALPFADGSFDVVTSMLALMHLPVADRLQVFTEVRRVLRPGGRMLLSVKNALFDQLSRADRFAVLDVTDVDNERLVFTRTSSGKDLAAPWHSFSPQDLTRLFATAGLALVELRGNVPLAAWLSDSVLRDPATYATVRALERVFAATSPLNHLGYHLLAEAVKPL